MTPERRKYVLFTALAVVILALDQWTKVLAREALRPLGYGAEKIIIDGFFNLRFSENTGVAFGMLQNLPAGKWLLTVVGAAALVLVVLYLRKTESSLVRLPVALGLVAGGAIGNLVDRILYGRVTDFIVWHWRGLEWPAFNIADAGLVVGVALMAMDMFRGEKKPERTTVPGTTPAGSSTDASGS